MHDESGCSVMKPVHSMVHMISVQDRLVLYYRAPTHSI